MSADVVQLGAEVIAFEVTYSSRRTLGITVEPDGRLVVAAPTGTLRDVIAARLRKRGAWILKTRRDFELLRPHTPPRRFVAGETHRFLGRQYRLALEPDAPRGVELGTDYIRVGGIPPDEPSRVRNRLAIWYQREARKVIDARFEAAWSRFGAGQRPRLMVRPMEKRWGSLSASGRSMIVNRRLVEADLDAIDFVIVHELTHLDHHHHGPEFVALLSARMPDWRERKKQLERWMA